MRRRVALARDLDRVSIDERGPAVHAFGAVPLEILRIDTTQALDIRVARAFEPAEIEGRRSELEAVVGSIVEQPGELGGVIADLFGHAADIHAGASEGAGLDAQPPGAVARGSPRGRKAPTAPADHDEIELPHGHDSIRRRSGPSSSIFTGGRRKAPRTRPASSKFEADTHGT